MRLNLSWRFDELHPEALAFYRGIERELGGMFYHETPIVRLLRDKKAAELWARRAMQPEILPHLRSVDGTLVDEAVFVADHGGFEMKNSGWLDTAAFLQASRRFFSQAGCWLTADVPQDALCANGLGVTWQGRAFSWVIFCTGWQAARHPWFDWVPFQSAQGTVLTLAADTGGERRIINKGCWLLPAGDGLVRAGPTYDLNFAARPDTPGAEAIASLEAKLRRLFLRPYEVLRQQTGVRPIIQGRQALMGRHPALPRVAFLNGLGSKGVLRAPWMARHLLEHLLDGCPLEDHLDLRANL
jgi:glycine/D-amino acid oxidase-like deaminating enzyme